MAAGAVPSRCAPAQATSPGLFWLVGFNSDMRGTKAQALAAWAASARPRLRPVRLFRPWRIRRRVHRRHDRPLARRKRRGVRRVLPRSAGRDRLLDGRLDGAAAGARAARGAGPSRAGYAGRTGADRAGARFHRGADVEEASRRRSSASLTRKGVWLRPSAYRRALSDHRAADRGGPQSSAARRHDRGRLPGAHPAGREDPDVPWQHAVALAHGSPRRRGADADPGRRSSAVAARGYRADDRGRRGVLTADGRSPGEVPKKEAGGFGPPARREPG